MQVMVLVLKETRPRETPTIPRSRMVAVDHRLVAVGRRVVVGRRVEAAMDAACHDAWPSALVGVFTL